jgi:predicted  nucleic acid-binding Zn-ribbon protein
LFIKSLNNIESTRLKDLAEKLGVSLDKNETDRTIKSKIEVRIKELLENEKNLARLNQEKEELGKKITDLSTEIDKLTASNNANKTELRNLEQERYKLQLYLDEVKRIL